MSVPFQKEVFTNGVLRLFVNFTGISQDNTTNKDDLSLTVYAINRLTMSLVFSETLDFEQIQGLYNHLNSISIIRDHSDQHSGKFVELTGDHIEILSIIKTVDSSLVKAVLNKVSENDKLAYVLEALNESEIQHLHASIRQTNHRKSLTRLSELLDLEENESICDRVRENQNLADYVAGQPEKIFQKWIEQNLWALGIDYIRKHPARQIGISSESDLIMETTDGYIDLIELKRPKFKLFDHDSSHNSSFPSKELSKVIGQCLQYLKVLDEYKIVLEKQYKFKMLKPRIKIIIGRTNNFSDPEHDTLRLLNSSLNHIQIISYDYLFQCGENIVSYYDKQISTSTYIKNDLPAFS